MFIRQINLFGDLGVNTQFFPCVGFIYYDCEGIVYKIYGFYKFNFQEQETSKWAKYLIILFCEFKSKIMKIFCYLLLLMTPCLCLELKCEPIKVDVCSRLGYKSTGMPNIMGHQTQVREGWIEGGGALRLPPSFNWNILIQSD